MGCFDLTTYGVNDFNKVTSNILTDLLFCGENTYYFIFIKNL